MQQCLCYLHNRPSFSVYLLYDPQVRLLVNALRLTLPHTPGRRYLLILGWRRLLGLAEVPVLREQVEEDALLRMCVDDIFIELDTQSWPLRQRKVSIHYLWIARRSGLHPFLCEVVEMFLNLEIGCGSRKMKGSSC